MMKLITEMNEDTSVLVEDVNGKKSMFIEGIFLQGNIKNRNGRIYPDNILEKEVARYNENYIAKSRALGELNHPIGPNINLDKVSHNIISLKKENNSSNYIGKAKLLEGTPNGDTAISLIKQGVSLAVSSRGLGSLKENKIGIMEVQDDFYLATAADIVADPSAPDAFVNGIMEGIDFFWTEGGALQATKAEQIYEETVDEIENAINHRELAEQKAILFNKFLQKLNTINR